MPPLKIPANAPDPMTRQRWARRIAEDLAGTRETKAGFEVTQYKHEHEPTDEVPGFPKIAADGITQMIENGRPVFMTYAEVYAENNAAQARLWRLAKEKHCEKLVSAIIESEVAADSD